MANNKTDIKTNNKAYLLDSRSQKSIIPYSFDDLCKVTGNIYVSVSIIAKRAREIHQKSKETLDYLLEEFGTPPNTEVDASAYLEERVAISDSFYSQPGPIQQACKEFFEGKIHVKNKDIEKG